MLASLVLSEMSNWNGDARLYRVDPPLDGHHFVAVEVWPESSQFDCETHVYAAWANGGAVAHPGGGLSPQRRYGGMESHVDALRELGYEVVIPAPVEAPEDDNPTPEGDSPGSETAPAETSTE